MAIYELFGSNGKTMQRIDVPANDERNNLQPGRILQMHGYSDPQYMILRNLGIDTKWGSGATYEAVNLGTMSMIRQQAYTLKWAGDGTKGIHVAITDKTYTTDQILDVVKAVKAADIRRKHEAEQASAAKRDEIAGLRKQYAHLEMTENSKKTGWALGASNLRKELRAAFPGVKFSVKSESYSMGCSISVSWQDGPTSKAVNAIADKYQYGTFDGMTDSSGYKDEEFTAIFGGAKHVSTSRHYSDTAIKIAFSILKKEYSGNWEALPYEPTVEDFNNGRLLDVELVKSNNGVGGGFWSVSNFVHKVLNRTTLNRSC